MRLIFALSCASLLAIVTHSTSRTGAKESSLSAQECNLDVVGKGDGYKRYLNLSGMTNFVCVFMLILSLVVKIHNLQY